METEGMSPENAALLKGVSQARPEMARAALASGADANAVDGDGYSMLALWALRSFYADAGDKREKARREGAGMEILQELLKAGADPNGGNERGDAPLHLVCGWDDAPESAIEALLRAGARPSAQNKAGRSALHWAAQKDYASKIAILLAAGADPALRDEQGQTAREQARRVGAGAAEGALLAFEEARELGGQAPAACKNAGPRL